MALKNKLSSIYIYGMPVHSINASIYGGLFGNATRSVGLAMNLLLLGHKVFLEVEDDFQNNILESDTILTPHFVKKKDREKILTKVDVLLVSCTNFDSLKKIGGRDPYLCHPKKLYACCFDNNDEIDIGNLKFGQSFISFNNKYQKNKWDKRKTGIRSFVVSYGVNENEYIEEAINDSPVENVIWIGGIRRIDMLQRLVKFASVNHDAKVNVVSRSIFDGGIPLGKYGSRLNPFGEFTKRDPIEVFDRIVQELCKIPKPDNLTFLGPMEGMNHNLLGNNSIGLDFSRFPAQDHDNTKIMDYLRSGICVICDKGTPSYRFVEETGYGVIVSPDFSEVEIRSAFQKCRAMVNMKKRQEVSIYMKNRYGWNTKAKEFSYLIQKLQTNRWLQRLIQKLG